MKMIMGEKDKKITTLPGTIKVAKDDYVKVAKKGYLKEGYTETESIKMAEDDYYRISINSEGRRARNRRKGN